MRLHICVVHIYNIYILLEQSKANNPEVPGSTPGSSGFSLVFIKNLINDKSKHKKKNVTIYIILSGAPHRYL